MYIQASLNSIWQELQENILLYDINEGLNIPSYLAMLEQTRKFTPDKKFITRYGGEFVAANRENAGKFISEARKIFNAIKDSGQVVTGGDEVIIAMTADKLKNLIRNAGSYIFRFWTGSFRLVSNCYKSNPVAILHMPSEKTRGLIKIYDKYIKKNKLPANKRVWKICKLSGSIKLVIFLLLCKIRDFLRFALH